MHKREEENREVSRQLIERDLNIQVKYGNSNNSNNSNNNGSSFYIMKYSGLFI